MFKLMEKIIILLLLSDSDLNALTETDIYALVSFNKMDGSYRWEVNFYLTFSAKIPPQFPTNKF
mgnify:CR=1 FL=1